MKVDLRNKKVSIIGAARSGIAAAYLAKRQGAQVFLSDATLPEDHDKLRKDFSEKKLISNSANTPINFMTAMFW